MGDFLRSEDLGSYLRDMERRVLALETSRRPSQTFCDVTLPEPVSTFSDTYETLFQIRIDVLVAPVLRVRLQASTAGVTQAVWRLEINTSTSAEVPFAGAVASYDTSFTFSSLFIGNSGITVNVQARRTSGASSLSLYYPQFAVLDYGATTSD
jgi:hypothetical protein